MMNDDLIEARIEAYKFASEKIAERVVTGIQKEDTKSINLSIKILKDFKDVLDRWKELKKLKKD